jgi:predicted Zn finger-like uncharacterized protein
MIIQCQSCAAKYFLPEDKVPAGPLKVRCPKCRAVFMLVPRNEPVPVAAAVGATPRAHAAPAAPPAPQAAPKAVPMEIETTALPRKKVANAAPIDITDDAPARASHPAPAAAPAPAPAPAKAGKLSKSEERAKRLARVLVSDILYYNRERRDQALRDGTLMSALSDEIKKSWELYKEKVGPEAAQSTNYFKEALNEILADGQQVF